MVEENDKIKNETRSIQIKNGIERAKSQGKKLGRPSIRDSKGDPKIAFKAAELRSQGLSWSQIASHLGIGRTTARRLVNLYLNKNSIWPSDEKNPSMPKSSVFNTSVSESQHIASSIDIDILGNLPKSFQIFSSLLQQAKKAQEK